MAIYFKWLRSVWVRVSNEKIKPARQSQAVGKKCLHLDLLKECPCEGFDIIRFAEGDREGFVFVFFLLWEGKRKIGNLIKGLTFR